MITNDCANAHHTTLLHAVAAVLDATEGSDAHCDAMNELAAAYDVCAGAREGGNDESE